MRLGLSLVVAVAACSPSASHADRRPGPLIQARSGDDLFGSTPHLPPILGRLGLGSRVGEIASLAPTLRAVQPWPAFANVVATAYAAPAHPGATFHFITRPSGDAIDAIILVVRDGARALDAIHARWGRAPHVSNRESHYQDVAAGVRAIVEGEPGTAVIVTYVPVVRIEQLLGRDRGRLGFERRSLIGASLADVPTLLTPGAHLDTPTSIALPRVDASAFAAAAALVVVDGKVAGYRFQLPCEWRADRKRALADSLASTFGPGVDVDLGQPGQLVIYVGDRE